MTERRRDPAFAPRVPFEDHFQLSHQDLQRALGIAQSSGGRFAEVLSDATVVWPLLMMGLLERQRARDKRPS